MTHNFFSLALACLILAVATFKVSCQKSEFVKASGTNFVKDGCPFYYGGANSYDLMTLNQRELDTFFETMQANNVTVVRTWAFANGNGTLSQNMTFMEIRDNTLVLHTGNMVALDRVLATAAKNDVKVILVLGNNWNEFGGVSYFEEKLKLDSHVEYFSNNVAKSVYKYYARYLANRINTITKVPYKNDTTIFSWELFNEPRQFAVDLTLTMPKREAANLITDWASEMCSYLKDIDPNHMVAVGDEGFYENASGAPAYIYSIENGVDHRQLSSLPCIDFVTVHLYDLKWGFTSSADPNVIAWIENQKALADSLGKPAILEEYNTDKTTGRTLAIKQWQKAVVDSNYAGSNLWNVRLKANQYTSNFDNLIIGGKSPETDPKVNLFPHAVAMAAKNVCPTKVSGPSPTSTDNGDFILLLEF